MLSNAMDWSIFIENFILRGYVIGAGTRLVNPPCQCFLIKIFQQRILNDGKMTEFLCHAGIAAMH